MRLRIKLESAVNMIASEDRSERERTEYSDFLLDNNAIFDENPSDFTIPQMQFPFTEDISW